MLNFFDTVTGQAAPSTNFRFGFVPFSTTANVGKLLQPLGYMVSSNWTYQSREVSGDVNSGSPTVTSVANTQSACTTGSTRSPTTAKTYASSGTATVTTVSYLLGACISSVQTVIPNWRYQQETFPVAGYVSGSTGVVNPAQVGGAISAAWPGCIEERSTTAGATTFNTSSPPPDLDVDTAPTDDGSRWKPMWPDVEFARLSTPETSSASRTVTARPYGTSMYETLATLQEEVACPAASSRLASMSLPAGSAASTKAMLRSTITNYMAASSGFRPYGKTYLDEGMIWGTRLISPTGMFASDTAAWPNHNAPNRYIIFLTDGAMETDQYAYSAHGMEQYDNRVSNDASSPALDDFHYARFAAACTMAKNRNITIFVIAYAQATISPQLSACASPGQGYLASDSTSLQTAFNTIAQQVALLRLSK